ncbi:tripartite motif-containing protein 67-like isoform X2 [Clavelina lepadiformis]|uniref:tripartite motif-containing protein 67-like isoform X2 n=1 Tax=Clavelina lepadiformis TaxID=159417 RepID=UPI004041A631
MLGAFKTWALGQRSGKYSPFTTATITDTNDANNSVFLISHSKQSSVDKEDYKEMEMRAYGHLLCCPLCEELFTHPVLLPCQHSLCYGCARAQLLSSEGNDEIADMLTSSLMLRKNSDSDLGRAVRATLLPESSPITRKFLPLRHGASPRSMTSGTDALPKSSKLDDSTIVSSTNCVHFEADAGFQGNSPRPNKLTKVFTPSRVTSSSYSSTFKPPSKPSTLRRSNSTSSLARKENMRHRYQQQQNIGSIKQSRASNLFCPTCEKKVDLGKQGISGLFRNFALESIVEKFRSAAKAAVAVRCGYCKPPAADATKSCLDCKLSYCNECFKAVHIWGTKKARHGYIGPTNNFTRPKVLLCPEHSNEVSMYCNKCKKSVCRMCKLGGGSHVNHSVSSAKSAYRESKERLYEDLAILKTKREAVDAKIETLGEAFKTLEQSEAQTRENIHSSLDDMHRLLEKKRNDLLAKTDAEMREKELILRQEMQRQQKNLMSASIASFAEEVLKEIEPSFFLQTSLMVELKLKEAIEQLSDNRDAAELTLNSPAMILDVDCVKTQLSNIDFISLNSDKNIDQGINGKETDQREDFSKDQHIRFHWVPTEQGQCIIIDDNARTAKIKQPQARPCVVKGNTPLYNGKHYWEISVTTEASDQIIVGVCNLPSDEKLHGSISRKSGAFLRVSPATACQLSEEWIENNLTSISDVKPIFHLPDHPYPNTPIGTHSFIVGISVDIHADHGLARFYDVSADDTPNRKLCFEKSFKGSPPFLPLVVVSGQATLKVV